MFLHWRAQQWLRNYSTIISMHSVSAFCTALQRWQSAMLAMKCAESHSDGSSAYVFNNCANTGREKLSVQCLVTGVKQFQVFMLQNSWITFMSTLCEILEYSDKATSDLIARIIELLLDVFRSVVWVHCPKITENYRRFTSIFKVYESGQSSKMGSGGERDSVWQSSRNGPLERDSRYPGTVAFIG